MILLIARISHSSSTGSEEDQSKPALLSPVPESEVDKGKERAEPQEDDDKKEEKLSDS